MLKSATNFSPVVSIMSDQRRPLAYIWRNMRALMLHYRLHQSDPWLERFVVWSAAALSALIIVGFVRLTDIALHTYAHIYHHFFLLSLLLPPAGGMLIATLMRLGFRGAEGSGIPQVIACLREDHPAPADRLISLPVVVGKIILGSAAMAAGFSTGREGPCVQIGAAMMYWMRRWLPVRNHISAHELILAGGAAGIAAAFNTPLAGIIFAIEELTRRFEPRTQRVLLTAIVIAGMVSISLQGNYLYFGHLHIQHLSTAVIIPVLMAALVCGIAGGLFSRTLLWSGVKVLPALNDLRKQHTVLFAGLCGLAISLLSLLSHGSVQGSGYDVTHAMLMEGHPVAWYYAPFKVMATALSFHSGVPGGIFAPSLAIGAGIGQDLLLMMGSPSTHGIMYALGMAGFLAAVTQSPITSTIIVMEMIDGHELVISLVAVSLLASLVSRGFTPSLYHRLSERYESPTDQ